MTTKPTTHQCVLCQSTMITPEMARATKERVLGEMQDLVDLSTEIAAVFGKEEKTGLDFIESMIDEVCNDCIDVDLLRTAVTPILTRIARDPLHLPTMACWHDARTGEGVKPHV
jgi:hypothetical protein